MNNKMISKYLLRIAPSVLLLALSSTALAGSNTEQPKGYIQNDSGEECWYTQQYEDGSYFHSSGIIGRQGILKFDDPECMRERDLGQDVNKMMINNVVSRWYSLPDADFMTRVNELHAGSMLQVNGKCIQSKTYPGQGIVIDYIMDAGSIVEVRHGSSLQGCS